MMHRRALAVFLTTALAAGAATSATYALANTGLPNNNVFIPPQYCTSETSWASSTVIAVGGQLKYSSGMTGEAIECQFPSDQNFSYPPNGITAYIYQVSHQNPVSVQTCYRALLGSTVSCSTSLSNLTADASYITLSPTTSGFFDSTHQLESTTQYLGFLYVAFASPGDRFAGAIAN